MPAIVKEHGTHLKACAAMLRLRLYDILCGLPPTAYEGAYKHLFRELVAEFTLTGEYDSKVTIFFTLLWAFIHKTTNYINQ